MKKSRQLGVVCACISLFSAPQAMSVTIDAYFGWNYESSNVTDTLGNPINLPDLALNSITYIGASGVTTQAMPSFGPGSGMPDGTGIFDNPTYTTTIGGDGETTRTVSTALPINWIDSGVMTPWGSTYAFPTISITSITAFGVSGSLTSSSQYVVGLIPFGSNTELDSTLGGVQGDIYDFGRLVSFTADPASGILGSGNFTFSAAAASPIPIPAAVWLFSSGLLGLISMTRKKKVL